MHRVAGDHLPFTTTWQIRRVIIAFHFLGPIAWIGLATCVDGLYSVRPVDKTSLTPFFVASMLSQPSKLIPDSGS